MPAMANSFARLALKLCLALTFLTVSKAAAEELSIAAASDLTYCLEELNTAFKTKHPDISLKATNGASGNFFAQIKNGAPFDIFMSADMSYPKELIKAGLADEKSLYLYAIGHIVVWTTDDKLDISGGLKSLANPSIQKIAIANPEHAPYGRAAKASLEHFKIWDQVKGNIVYGENISQTAQFVETGNAQAGIVALSLVLSPKLANVGRWTQVPLDSYPRLEQGAIITNKGMKNPASALYMAFLASPEAREVFERFGFRLNP